MGPCNRPDHMVICGMTRLVDIAAIEARRKEIAEELDRLEREMDELDMALRVFGRFWVRDDPQPIASTVQASADASARLGPVRPDGIPSNYEMAVQTIGDATKAGRKGLTAAELVEEIGRRWWPGVQGPQILPIMYQFAKKGRLNKGDDGYFRLPTTAEKNEAPADRHPQGASEPSGESGTSPEPAQSAPHSGLFE